MTGMVMHSAHRMMHLRHWLRSHRLGAGWRARCCVLRKGETGKTDCGSSGSNKVLNHGNSPSLKTPRRPLMVLTENSGEALFVPTLTRSRAVSDAPTVVVRGTNEASPSFQQRAVLRPRKKLPMDPHERPVVTDDNKVAIRAGSTGNHVRYVLIVSTALVIVCFIAIALFVKA